MERRICVDQVWSLVTGLQVDGPGWCTEDDCLEELECKDEGVRCIDLRLFREGGVVLEADECLLRGATETTE